MTEDIQPPPIAPQDPVAAGPVAVFYDGATSRRRQVTLTLADKLVIREAGETLARWPYDDIRRMDASRGLVRLACLRAPQLARLEIRDSGLAAQVLARCPRVDASATGPRDVGRIVGWSLAAAASIVGMVLYGVPFAADRLAPLIPQSFERRLGDAAEGQVMAVFDGKPCRDAAGEAAFARLMAQLHGALDLATDTESLVLSSKIANAFALPGGKVFLLRGLLDKAETPDEIAGVLAHELGHLKHRDNTRQMISQGGTSFLIGLLFGDITGSSALIFAGRSIVDASYSREAETAADTAAIEAMHRLGRSPKPMGELLFRITGKESGKGISVLASHPFTEDRLARMTKEDRPPSGPPLLTDQEWAALKGVCKTSDNKGSDKKPSDSKPSDSKPSPGEKSPSGDKPSPDDKPGTRI
ncbi:M48 family metallopeptidase [Bradyrhizobium sp. U87765 SZCCT0131]|uniref:M48 family metallopeptidase n=1 Tax=unclassified Bradyrhizobium TaxID=2631580 RepID=UPI001BA7795D|nr:MULTISPECIES: M48 family metallopeptidase [unclassified Bradyrhizobium]MBR1222907.1 M48 family metallopeptidase [Bradyrhizobium sp. U87765 SZCCT0131]MBR1262643.1 M48 family metallopeptidase [Bradyrhizobium sp. U87765 SZCCT0134]MBR1308885.1 M48 family metallopeptidase [Bradyrhizobium sp. U87765 SZCCT0110]MBR1318425.1 M48 family metallopeptidase [Bradyrhizobium sp. U87765 SZCCT0109]MBR1352129.1 M48 family metallopeptidase [Bradyrhizobium sp. U87765 SZCCT0048]